MILNKNQGTINGILSSSLPISTQVIKALCNIFSQVRLFSVIYYFTPEAQY